MTVTPAALTVTADAQTKGYGGANPTLTATATGLVGSDTLAGLSLGYTLSTTATTTSPVGTYPITFSGGAASTANYGPITYTAGTLTVTSPPSLSIADSSVTEGNTLCSPTTPMPFTVTLSAASAQSVTVGYQT